MTIDQVVMEQAHCSDGKELKYRTQTDIQDDNGNYIAFCCVEGGNNCPFTYEVNGHYRCDICGAQDDRNES